MASEPTVYDTRLVSVFNFYSHREVLDEIYTSTNFLKYLYNDPDMYKEYDGGEYINTPAYLIEQSTFQFNSGSQTADIDHQDTVRRSNWKPGMITTSVRLYDTEVALNQGDEKILDLFELKKGEAALEANEGLSKALFANLTDDGSSICGLQTLISDTPGANTVGGLSETTYPSWANKQYDLLAEGGDSSFSTAQSGIKAVRSAQIQSNFKWGNPKLLVCDQITYTAWQDLAGDTLRTMAPTRAGDLGIPHITHDSAADVIWDRHVGWTPGGTDPRRIDGSASDASSTDGGRVYGINPKALCLYANKSLNWHMTPFVRAQGGVDSVALMEFLGQFVRHSGRDMYVITGVNR